MPIDPLPSIDTTSPLALVYNCVLFGAACGAAIGCWAAVVALLVDYFCARFT